MSRFLYQLLYDHKFDVNFRSIKFNILERIPKPITIFKNAEIINKLDKYTSASNSYLSPSSLSLYLDCRLKFYFSKIVDLKEPDEALEEIEARDIGILLHDTLFRLYKLKVGSVITSNEINEILTNESIKSALDAAVRKEFYKTSNESVEVRLEGKNIIIYNVIQKYVEKILQIDEKWAPFEILSLEEFYFNNFNINTTAGNLIINIGGKIDRIDRKDKRIRIIDYKTGFAETKIKSLDELFDRTIPQRNKAIFQTLVYTWMYAHNANLNEVITPELYITRNIFEDDFNSAIRLNNHIIDFFEIENSFLLKLKETLEEIFDKQVPFDQTTVLDNCRSCDFAKICHRTALN